MTWYFTVGSINNVELKTFRNNNFVVVNVHGCPSLEYKMYIYLCVTKEWKKIYRMINQLSVEDYDIYSSVVEKMFL